ncbi:Hypothetical protein A7982_03206 [Minicystis rosea]|nr:Hypothetical protein A7982_03206 [Minicystis rosea]
MAIWTDGKDMVLATGHGIARWSGNALQALPYATAGRRRDEDPPEMVSFVMLDAAGKRALVQRAGEPPALWTHGAGRLAPCEGAEQVEAIAAAPGGPMVALWATRPTEGAARLSLRRAALEGARLVLGDEIAIPEAPRLSWRDSIMKEGEGFPEQPFGADEDDEPEQPPFDPRVLAVGIEQGTRTMWRGAVRLSANRFGVGISSTYSGLVGVLDPRTLAFRIAARAPTLREQFDLFAAPAAAGMVVTLVANYRHTEHVLVDEQGAVRGSRRAFGKDVAWGGRGPALAWDDATVLVSQNLNDDEVYSLSLPALGAKRFGNDPGILVDGGSSADGSAHAIALTQANYMHPKNWRIALWTKRGARFRATEVEAPDFRPVEPPRPPPGPERHKGAPSLAVSADPATPWRGTLGGEITLRVRVENRGGPVRGLFVEVSGAALADGLSSAVAVEGDGPPSTPVRKGAVARAELAKSEIQAGFAPSERRDKSAPPLPPQPAITLTLRVRADKAGQGLLSVRVGPLGASGTTSSGMVGRTLVVTTG